MGCKRFIFYPLSICNTFFVSDTLYASIFLNTPFWRRFGKNVSRIIYAKYDTLYATLGKSIPYCWQIHATALGGSIFAVGFTPKLAKMLRFSFIQR